MAVKKIIHVVDAQFDFMKKEGKLYVEGAEALIPGLVEYLKNLNPNEVEAVVFTFDTHFADEYADSEEGKMFPIHCEYMEEGWFLVVETNEDVAKNIPIYFIDKGVFDVWAQDGLVVVDTMTNIEVDRDVFFNNLKAAAEARGDILEVEMVGVAADFCVKWAADGYVARNFPVRIRRDLVKGIVRQIDQVVDEDFQGKDVKVI